MQIFVQIQIYKLSIFSYSFENIPFVSEQADSKVFHVFAHLCKSLLVISHYQLIKQKCVNGWMKGEQPKQEILVIITNYSQHYKGNNNEKKKKKQKPNRLYFISDSFLYNKKILNIHYISHIHLFDKDNTRFVFLKVFNLQR